MKRGERANEYLRELPFALLLSLTGLALLVSFDVQAHYLLHLTPWAKLNTLLDSLDLQAYRWVLGLNYVRLAFHLDNAEAAVVGDFVVAGLFALFFLLVRHRWGTVSGIRAVACMILVHMANVYFFDHGEFYVHVTEFQLVYGVALWFTNADLTVLLSAVLVALTLARYLGPRFVRSRLFPARFRKE